ncbi:MAG: hypothetical protein JKY52_14665 [Flavobacteriales bacterium]|nr:hypothetical protein [Flavobacteriales bacterium]
MTTRWVSIILITVFVQVAPSSTSGQSEVLNEQKVRDYIVKNKIKSLNYVDKYTWILRGVKGRIHPLMINHKYAVKYIYDMKGRVISLEKHQITRKFFLIRFKRKESKFIFKLTYSYNSEGEVKSYADLSSYKKSKSLTEHDYSYDAKGRLVEVIVQFDITDGGKKKISERTNRMVKSKAKPWRCFRDLDDTKYLKDSNGLITAEKGKKNRLKYEFEYEHH